MPCPQAATVGLTVLAGVDHTLVSRGTMGSLYMLTVLAVALVTLLAQNDTRKTGPKVLNLLLKIKPKGM